MATAVNRGSGVATGVVIAIAVVIGLLALVGVNFNNNPPSQYSAPTLPR